VTRIYKDYIDACVEATNKSPIPKLFRTWAALSSVSGALGRRVWMPMANYDIRSNIFVVLVAGPGRNKSVSLILPFSKVFRKLTTPVGTTPDHDHFNSGLIEYGLKEFPLYLIQDRITPEKLAVDMSKASRFDMRLSTIGDEFYDGSLTLVTSELGTFLSRHERYLQMFLTDMWDSKEEYSHKTKTAGEHIIKGPCLNWIACATPEQFVDNLPEDARSQGLLSRIIPVFYDGEKIPQSLLQDRVEDSTIHNLRSDLSEIAKMYGPMRFDDRAFDKINQDIESGLKPIPTDANLSEYTQRRVSHFIKVALAVSASSSKDKVITWDQWQRTKDLMFEVEESMPKALAGFGMARAGKLAQDMAVWTKETMSNTERNFVSLRHFKRELLRRTLAPGESEQTVKAMEEAGYIQVKDGLVFPIKL
tara:strand:- start:8028 stop:9284 length:1257 start_codon:yes stop_codon:yes gene_type:complete